MTAPGQTLRKGVAFRDLHAAGTFVMPNPDANALMETDGSQ